MPQTKEQKAARAREYRIKNRDKFREYDRKRNKTPKRKEWERLRRQKPERRLKARQRANLWYHNNRELANKQSHERYQHCDKLKRFQHARECRAKLKTEVYALLGGKCINCGFSDVRALQIDHINGGGLKDKREIPNASNYLSYYAHIIDSIKNGEQKYQLLCANCNWIKRIENNENRGRSVKQ